MKTRSFIIQKGLKFITSSTLPTLQIKDLIHISSFKICKTEILVKNGRINHLFHTNVKKARYLCRLCVCFFTLFHVYCSNSWRWKEKVFSVVLDTFHLWPLYFRIKSNTCCPWMEAFFSRTWISLGIPFSISLTLLIYVFSPSSFWFDIHMIACMLHTVKANGTSEMQRTSSQVKEKEHQQNGAHDLHSDWLFFLTFFPQVSQSCSASLLFHWLTFPVQTDGFLLFIVCLFKDGWVKGRLPKSSGIKIKSAVATFLKNKLISDKYIMLYVFSDFPSYLLLLLPA